jgi:hypothetical protein
MRKQVPLRLRSSSTSEKQTAPEEKKEMNGSSYLSAYHKITG